jgi:hypothetical protein
VEVVTDERAPKWFVLMADNCIPYCSFLPVRAHRSASF